MAVMDILSLTAQPRGRTRRPRRGFDIIQLAIVMLLIAMLTAVSYRSLSAPAEEARREYLTSTLLSVDQQVRSLARQGNGTVTPELLDRVVASVALPSDQVALPVTDENRARLAVVGEAGGGVAGFGDTQVWMLWFKECAILTVPVSGAQQGQVHWDVCTWEDELTPLL